MYGKSEILAASIKPNMLQSLNIRKITSAFRKLWMGSIWNSENILLKVAQFPAPSKWCVTSPVPITPCCM